MVFSGFGSWHRDRAAQHMCFFDIVLRSRRWTCLYVDVFRKRKDGTNISRRVLKFRSAQRTWRDERNGQWRTRSLVYTLRLRSRV
jgi:hypothetical protein